MDFLDKPFKLALLGIASVEVLSLLSNFQPSLSTAGFLWIVVITLLLTFKRLEYGLLILLAELSVGSKGQIFTISWGDFTVSIRLAIFAIILGVWIILVFKKTPRVITPLKRIPRPVIWSFMVLLIFIIFGIGQGLTNFALKTSFFDFNAWLFLILAGVFVSVIQTPQNIKNLLEVILAATTWIAAKTIFLLVLFSNDLSVIGDPLYSWIRHSGVGEITHVSGTIFRIFLQSQIFLLAGLIVALALVIIKHPNWRQIRPWLLVYIYLSSLAIIISQSRSFWIGTLIGILVLLSLGLWSKQITWKKSIISTGLLIILLFSHIITVNLITRNFSGNPLLSRLSQLKSEPAAVSRLNQLSPLSQAIKQQPLIGYGFGKELTYRSQDPRILQNNPTGLYTTTAFEWGYLDIILKIGLLGLVAYLLWLFWLILPVLLHIKNTHQTTPLLLGCLAGLSGLLTTNIFSPYLNHPLGIGLLLIFGSIFMVAKNNRSNLGY